MKFGHDFKQSLESQGFPPHWVAQAIPYGQLKKCLKKVQRELQELGLDRETLKALLDSDTGSPVALNYSLNASSNSTLVRPKLTVFIHLHDGNIVDASLTPTTRQFFEKISSGAAGIQSDDEKESALATISRLKTTDKTTDKPIDKPTDNAADKETNNTADTTTTVAPQTEANHHDEDSYERIEVPLVFDSVFFDMLLSDVSNLDALQTTEQNHLQEEVKQLGKQVSQVSRPSRFSKSDMDRWRRIFELYLDAEIFFATHEREHGARSSQKALKQLQWFQGEVNKQQLVSSFKLPESQTAFSKFLELNLDLLKHLQFQELNVLAISKILKKFDKRTALGVSRALPAAINSRKLLSDHISKAVCARISDELVSIIPQINDYLCPICYSLAYQPVRLDCQHLFCIRCIIKIQRRKEESCPLCRAPVVMNASIDNLDADLEKFMKKYFMKEVKEKQRANEIERGIEEFGPGYTRSECSIM
ncbi:SPX domain-containing protein [Trichoderma austrokoningii]